MDSTLCYANLWAPRMLIGALITKFRATDNLNEQNFNSFALRFRKLNFKSALELSLYFQVNRPEHDSLVKVRLRRNLNQKLLQLFCFP